MKTVSMLGDGAWGTAVATLLAHNGYQVKLWCHDAANADTIKRTRINERYLPGYTLSEHIIPITSLEDAFHDIQWIFEAVPVQYLRSVLEQSASYITPDHVWIVLSKGIEGGTLMLPTQIIDDVLKSSPKKAVVAGPSFAADVAKKQATAVSVAATESSLAHTVRTMLENDYFKPFFNADLLGVQAGGAVKNVMTLGVGMLDGAGYTDNTKAFLLTRGLYEMALIAKTFGGDPTTLYGLSGVGDLVLTSMGKLSRNLEVGKRLGRGDRLQLILDELGHVPEGINAIKSVKQLIQKKKLELPIAEAIHDIALNGRSIEDLIIALMIHTPTEES